LEIKLWFHQFQTVLSQVFQVQTSCIVIVLLIDSFIFADPPASNLNLGGRKFCLSWTCYSLDWQCQIVNSKQLLLEEWLELLLLSSL
jgi:hypothetical protein